MNIGGVRRVPDDDTLRRIFDEHRDLTTRQILDRFGWPVVLHTLREYRRNLTRPSSGIEGVASMGRDEFAAILKSEQVKRLDGRYTDLRKEG